MNKDAYLIDNNKYLITSEDGNIRLVQKRDKINGLDEEVLKQTMNTENLIQDEEVVKRILKTENLIEKAEIGLYQKETELNQFKHSDKNKKAYNILTYILELALFMLCTSTFPIITSILITLLNHAFFKLFGIMFYGTKSKIKIKKETLTQEISELKLLLDTLYKQLDEMKKIIEFEELSLTEEIKNNIKPVIHIDPEVKIDQNKPKIRVLKLEK